jgi:predicted nucleic acid-binding protein
MKGLRLVDTSMWTCVIRRSGYETERAEVISMLRDGTAAWCEAIKLELWRGVSSEYDRAVLGELESELPCLPISDETWKLACELANVGRANGKQFPSPDLLIFSCAHQHRVPVCSRDKHFAELEDLIKLIKKTEN